MGCSFVWCPTRDRSWPIIFFFFLYIIDISTAVDSEIRLFADDCVCCREISDAVDSLQTQKDLDRLGVWAKKMEYAILAY